MTFTCDEIQPLLHSVEGTGGHLAQHLSFFGGGLAFVASRLRRTVGRIIEFSDINFMKQHFQDYEQLLREDFQKLWLINAIYSLGRAQFSES